MKITQDNIYINIMKVKNTLYDTELRTNNEYIKREIKETYNIIKNIEKFLINNKQKGYKMKLNDIIKHKKAYYYYIIISMDKNNVKLIKT